MTATTTDAHRSPQRTLRIGTLLIVSSAVASLVVEQFHPAHEPPNNHPAVFAEYAASHNWGIVHLAAFVCFLFLLAGLLALLQGLRRSDRPSLLIRAGEAATIVTGAVMAVLQGVDGVALKHAVDSWAAAPAELKAAAFRDAETVRWMEWAMAGYFRIVLGIALALLGLAVLRSAAVPRWTGAFAIVAGAAHFITGVAIGENGFEGTVKETANLVSWAAFLIFAITVTAAAWWPRRRQRAGRAMYSEATVEPGAQRPADAAGLVNS
jgi:hypothetical protein